MNRTMDQVVPAVLATTFIVNQFVSVPVLYVIGFSLASWWTMKHYQKTNKLGYILISLLFAMSAIVAILQLLSVI